MFKVFKVQAWASIDDAMFVVAADTLGEAFEIVKESKPFFDRNVRCEGEQLPGVTAESKGILCDKFVYG